MMPAHIFRADARLALENIDEAVKAFEAALDTEKKLPNLVTNAKIDLPFLIASRCIQAKYPLAMTLLADPGALLFPIQRFKHHASLGLMLAERDELSAASLHAGAALREAQAEESGLRYHRQLGLVADVEHSIRLRLLVIAGDQG
jgi:hypothetical protein